MQLRHHPLLSYRGIHSWPPVWTLMRGTDKERPRGEVGILKEVQVSSTPPPVKPDGPRADQRIFLFIEYQQRGYLGCLILEDYAFCQQLAQLLPDYYNRTIEEIGSIEVGRTM